VLPERVHLAARSHQTSLAKLHSGLAGAQTGCVEVGPNLLRTISGNRLDIEPVSLGQGTWFTRLDLRSKTGQSNNGRSQEAKYCQGCKRFDHLRLLTVAATRSRRARGSIVNSHDDQEFPQAQFIFECVIHQ
jgi:hypothetical protein